MHNAFSPAKMWIAGLKSLEKPFLHFHTSSSKDTLNTIDMDYMNTNQFHTEEENLASSQKCLNSSAKSSQDTGVTLRSYRSWKTG